MRRQQHVTAQLAVFIQTNRFRPQDSPYNARQTVSLPIAMADTGKLITAALRGLEAIWRPGYRYKKAGVMFLDLHPATAVQAGLFDQPDTPKAQARMRVIDGLNRRYGRGTVAFGATGQRRPWTMRRDYISPCYTTAWADLLKVG